MRNYFSIVILIIIIDENYFSFKKKTIDFNYIFYRCCYFKFLEIKSLLHFIVHFKLVSQYNDKVVIIILSDIDYLFQNNLFIDFIH